MSEAVATLAVRDNETIPSPVTPMGMLDRAVQSGARIACHLDFPAYVVGDDGSVISFVHRRPKQLKRIKRGEYDGHSMRNKVGAIIGVTLHRLVAETFLDPRAPGQEVRHMDGNRGNCSVSNLCWGTRSENMRDKERHGTAPIGQNHPMAKLNDRSVCLIRRMHRGHVNRSLVLQYFSISPTQHWRIVMNRAWTHIPPLAPRVFTNKE